MVIETRNENKRASQVRAFLFVPPILQTVDAHDATSLWCWEIWLRHEPLCNPIQEAAVEPKLKPEQKKKKGKTRERKQFRRETQLLEQQEKPM